MGIAEQMNGDGTMPRSWEGVAESDFKSVLNEAFEIELRRDPYQPKVWLSYIDTIKVESGGLAKNNSNSRSLMYERAVQAIPMCYKIWRRYYLQRYKKQKSSPKNYQKTSTIAFWSCFA